MYSAHVLSSMLLFIGCIQSASSRAVIEIHFIRYQASCTEDAGTRECDPKFTFCLKRDTDPMSISSCYYGSAGESSHYQDTNDIDFSYRKDVGGIPNPWIIPLDKDLGKSVLFVIRIRDDDIFGDEHLQTWGTNLSEVVYPSKDVAQFTTREASSGGYKIKFEIRMYCEANYYTSNCSAYCNVQGNSTVPFTCDATTGNKVCTKGWTGVNCTEDINECSQQICETGACENLVGDYICHCPTHYTGDISYKLLYLAV
ncbi:protein serrate-like [Physella acuta]|uniref:protein serrate-like n=1 Tax=Physella acuta TaxID=109671 RepID=UPI0027DD8401|nr:protein serrate-like [Physella acuta]